MLELFTIMLAVLLGAVLTIRYIVRRDDVLHGDFIEGRGSGNRLPE
jgi:hypothetical protein